LGNGDIPEEVFRMKTQSIIVVLGVLAFASCWAAPPPPPTQGELVRLFADIKQAEADEDATFSASKQVREELVPLYALGERIQAGKPLSPKERAFADALLTRYGLVKKAKPGSVQVRQVKSKFQLPQVCYIFGLQRKLLKKHCGNIKTLLGFYKKLGKRSRKLTSFIHTKEGERESAYTIVRMLSVCPFAPRAH